MWLLGGNDGSGKNDVWYSSDGANWTQATSSAAWSARWAHTAVVFDNKMWVLGGTSGGSSKHDVWYSSDGTSWTQGTAAAEWTARWGHTSVVLDNKIWVLGGNDGSNKNDVWYSDGVAVIDEQDASPPRFIALNGAYPCAFTEQTRIYYSLPRACRVGLRIVSANGARIRSLACGDGTAGRHCADWDGHDQSNHGVPEGVYFCLMSADNFTAALKLVKLSQP